MTVIVKVKPQQLVVPLQLQRRAGFKAGDHLEFKASRGVITIAAKQDDDYTPVQRRAIERRLDAADEDVKNGNSFGPFDTAAEMLASLHKEARAIQSKTPKRVPK